MPAGGWRPSASLSPNLSACLTGLREVPPAGGSSLSCYSPSSFSKSTLKFTRWLGSTMKDFCQRAPFTMTTSR